ncbi:MAG: hypothetical protein RIR65_1774 [Planctomycetota bacterium]
MRPHALLFFACLALCASLSGLGCKLRLDDEAGTPAAVVDPRRESVAASPAEAAQAPRDAGFSCEFELSPIDEGGVQRVLVRAAYRGLPPGETLDFLLPDRHSFVQLEPRWHAPPRARTADGVDLPLESVEPWRLRATKGTRDELVLELDIRLDHRAQPAVAGRDEYEHPGACTDGSLILFGSALFPLPESLPQDRPLAAKVRVRDSRPITSPWPRAEDGALAPTDPWALQSDVLLVGSFATTRIEIDGSTVQCAFAPGNERLRSIVPPLVEAIVREQCRQLRRPPAGDWLFLFNPPEPVAGRSLAGSPKRNSMTLVASGSFAAGELEADLAHLLAHEYHHTFATARGPGFQGALRFVGEGFTDWQAWRTALACGAIDEARWTQVAAKKLADDAALRETARLSLADAGGMAFFMDKVAYEQVYTCGFALALVLDAELARAGRQDFDAFYRGLLDDMPQDLDGFLARVESATSAEARGWFERAVGGVGGSDALGRLAAIGVRVETRTGPAILRANLEPLSGDEARGGVRVVDIDPSDAAAVHGLAAQDILESIDGVVVRTVSEARARWGDERGDTIELRARRGEQEFSIVMPAPRKSRAVDFDAPAFLARMRKS